MADTSRYMKSIETVRDKMTEALKVFNDPYQAPEVQAFAAAPVLNAIWDMNVEYAALMQKGEDEKVAEGERT
jgi:hypothetical protein